MKLAFSVVMEELKKEEGFRAKVYKCTAGKNTIGFGRNLDDNGITYEEAEYLLKNDIKMVDTWLNDNVPIYANLTPTIRLSVTRSNCRTQQMTARILCIIRQFFLLSV